MQWSSRCVHYYGEQKLAETKRILCVEAGKCLAVGESNWQRILIFSDLLTRLRRLSAEIYCQAQLIENLKSTSQKAASAGRETGVSEQNDFDRHK